MQIEHKGETRLAWTSSKFLMTTIRKVPEDKFPLITTIEEKEDGSYQFT